MGPETGKPLRYLEKLLKRKLGEEEEMAKAQERRVTRSRTTVVIDKESESEAEDQQDADEPEDAFVPPSDKESEEEDDDDDDDEDYHQVENKKKRVRASSRSDTGRTKVKVAPAREKSAEPDSRQDSSPEPEMLRHQSKSLLPDDGFFEKKSEGGADNSNDDEDDDAYQGEDEAEDEDDAEEIQQPAKKKMKTTAASPAPRAPKPRAQRRPVNPPWPGHEQARRLFAFCEYAQETPTYLSYKEFGAAHGTDGNNATQYVKLAVKKWRPDWSAARKKQQWEICKKLVARRRKSARVAAKNAEINELVELSESS